MTLKSASSDIRLRYRAIPSVQDLLADPAFAGFAIHPDLLKAIIQEEVQKLREMISTGAAGKPDHVPQKLRSMIEQRLRRLTQPSLKRVINATGIILHTNMGRAPLPQPACEALEKVAENYSNLEMDLRSGRRSDRMGHVEELLCLLTGAEAALVVNNCAAAVLLVLNSLCKRREVVVSRGELVEIGGSFRMPDVMKVSGAHMQEVGTTNKTHLADYQAAVSPKTGALLKVHTSNFRVLGFTESPDLSSLVALAAQHQIPLIYDMGSGVLENLQNWGYPCEPVTRDILATGVDVVTFSGDKILGGPQAGIILGKKRLLQKIRKNPLNRALRCDKLILAALEATLRLYLRPADLPNRLPVAAMLTVTVEELQRRAAEVIRRCGRHSLKVISVAADSQMGSGALPLEKIPSVALRITSPKKSPLKLAEKFRAFDPPICGYVQDEALLLNLRTVREDELPAIAAAIGQIGGQ